MQPIAIYLSSFCDNYMCLQWESAIQILDRVGILWGLI